MNTEIKITRTNYNVVNQTDNIKIEGEFSYSNFIDSLNCVVYGLESNHLGNISYQEFGDGNTNINYTVPMEYTTETFNLLQTIISEIKTELNKTDNE